VSIHTASRIARVRLVGLGLWLASQASRVYLRRMAIHTATGEASRVYSVSQNNNNVSIELLLLQLLGLTAHGCPLHFAPQGTFTIARRCCGVFMILVPDTKLQTYLLSPVSRLFAHFYLLSHMTVHHVHYLNFTSVFHSGLKT